MLKKNKFKIIISSIIILLPILFGLVMWDKLPDIMTIHWGADGNADGAVGKAMAVFRLPVIFLAVHLICLLVTSLDKKQKDQNRKALEMVFWIMPVISLFANGIMYSTAFEKEINIKFFLPALLGVIFILIGNYTPKVKQNRTLGIKISWTLNNEENWNKTHRFSGKVWVAGGLIMLFSVFLPIKVMILVMAFVLSAMIIAPVIYSYCIYRQHKKDGIIYSAPKKSKANKITAVISAVIVAVILIGVAILMFTGDIEVHCDDTSFTINATHYTDTEVEYSEIDAVEYRTSMDLGIRTSGFNSARLSMGVFQNDEFGSYTLYAYNSAKEFIVLTSGGKTLVIGMKNAEDTQMIYNTICEKTA